MTTLACPAKVNFFLAIRDRDSSGYHEIETILVRTKQLQDFIHIKKSATPSFECDSLPAEDNSVLKAIQILEQESNRKFSYQIRLEKHIPPMSGLGGGASDAAAIMLFLNKKENLKIPHKRLMELATKIGMDVPFFISGHQVALGTHYGEIITQLPDLPENLKIKIHLTDNQVSTKQAYKNHKPSSKISSSKIIAAIKKQNPHKIIKHLHNDFQTNSSFSNSSNEMLLAGSGGAFFSVHVSDNSQTQKS